MAFDYATAAQDALADILGAGTTLTMTRKTAGGTFNPATGAISGATTATQSIAAVVLPAKGGVTSFDDSMKEAFIRGRLRYVLAAALKPDGTALDFTPRPGDLLTLGGNDWEVYGVSPLSPGGDPVIYQIGIMEGGQ